MPEGGLARRGAVNRGRDRGDRLGGCDALASCDHRGFFGLTGCGLSGGGGDGAREDGSCI